eukprot:TRINITY_DN15880_c0_g1_i1.p3 TRINITY_DN15880_c0_g1~~TRINITY_DN15880_c0_g1_i1.p3  ORF type:complete len:225 (+),score=58.38 TRINITY_DN15880_c0_g1_i1:377-1051(+)
MPELSEVEAMRRLAEKYCVGRRIVKVQALEAGGGPRDGQFDDKVICEGATAESVVAALAGRTVLASKRLGKHMWLELTGEGPCVMFHFGMTGSLAVEGGERLNWQSFSVDADKWPPRFTKLQMQLTKAQEDLKNDAAALTDMVFVDARRMAKILFRKSPLQEAPLASLAPDPIVSSFELAAFAGKLKCSSLSVKALLMDQERAVCGLGNWLVDEVLCEARIHPA